MHFFSIVTLDRVWDTLYFFTVYMFDLKVWGLFFVLPFAVFMFTPDL